jgi:exosortase N
VLKIELINSTFKGLFKPLKYTFSFTILAFLLYVSLYDTHDKRPLNTLTLLTIKYLEDTHCPKSQAHDGILKYDDGEILVYLKPIPGFYAAEHSPMICWQGSGYVFGQVKSTYMGGMELYTGILKKGDETLQTAWWYDNGKTRTASQTVWRTAILHGEPNFNLVNITAGDSVSLRHNIERILATD